MTFDPLANSLRELAAVAPQFSAEQFLEVSLECFHQVKRAWWKQDLELASRITTGQAREALVRQIQRQLSTGRLERSEGVEVLEYGIVRAPDELVGPELTVRFFYRAARELTVDVRTGTVLDVVEDAHHREDLTLWLSPEAAEELKAARPDRCPVCSAPLQLEGGRCVYCSAQVGVPREAWQVVRYATIS